GLRSNDVVKIIQDSRGYLWATTMGNGIYRFNGNTFDNYTEKDGLGDNNTGSIVELPDGRLMILSLKCISIYDGLKFTNYTSKDGLALPGQWASTAFDKKGRLWIALWNADETRQLLYFENNRFHDITPVNPFLNAPESLLLSVVKNGDGDIIVNTLGNMYIVNDTVLNEYNPGVPAEVSENWLNLFYETADHTQFFLSFDAKIQKLSIFTLQNGVITYLDMPAEVGYWFLSGVCEDHENNLWVPSEFGLWRVSSNGEVKHFNEQNGLPIELVFWVTEDNENNIWLATRGLGLIKFMGEKFICLNEKDGLKSSKVYFNFKDSQGNIWFSTPTDQVCKFNGSEILYIDAPDNRETLGFFETNEHQVIVLTYQGLFDANSSNGYQLNNMFDLESDVIPYIAYNDGKYIWFSANGSSLIRFDGKTSAVVSAEEIGAEAGTILSITSDNIGNVWFAANAGYIKWDGKMYSYTTYPKNSISPDDIAVDKWNRVWIALYGGLLLVDTHGQRLLTTEDGLSSGYYVSLGFDNKGNMYAGYNQGFDLISFTQDGSVSSIKYYGKGDGFIGSSLGAQNINTDKKGNLYFATTQGLIRLDPSQLTPNTKPPIVNIRKIKLFYKDVNWESSEFRKFCDSVSPWFRLPVNLCLPYDKNHVTFEFEAICFTNPDAVKYQWMLQGLEKDWSPVSEQTKAEYANLEPGDYTFLVKACNNDGVW
ncbi:MAG TPA: triple tyrosine motif-containing protein, partial [Bacteroidales bacterium]|nr:triple tyrosine motif-containing protein [Bacteroidales bacterium]